MRRNDDLLRQLLIEFEAQADWVIINVSTMDMSSEARLRQHHIDLLVDQKFLAPVGKETLRLTSQGHDFFEAIRDDGIWSRTKTAVSESGGSATLEILKALATGFLRKQIFERTGIEI